MAGARWSKDADAELILAIRAYGSDWERIGDKLGRTYTACQQHANKCLRKEMAEALSANRKAAKQQRDDAQAVADTPSRDKRLETEIVRLREEGRSWSAIGDTVGLKRDKVRAVYAVAVGQTLSQEIDIYEVLRPIAMPAPPSRPCVFTPSSCDVIAGDFHFPKSSKESEAVLLGAIKRLRPATVYLNGDIFDMMAQSRFDKEYRKTYRWVPQDEADAGAKFLHGLEDIVQEWDGKIVMTEGNHEERWWRWLNQIAPSLVAMDRAEEHLSFQRWFIPAWSRLTIADDDIVIMDDLTITHGNLVRANGGASANAMGRKLFSSVVMGHTHRMGMSMIRVPARGTRTEQVIRSYELGCMADLMPPYVKKPDWTNGFGVLIRDEKAQSWTLEPVPIINGKATIATLGGTICA